MFTIGNNARIAILVSATLIASGSPVLPIGAVRAQAAHSGATATAKQFVGTWNWVLHDRHFATMILEQRGDQFGGSMTNCSIDMDKDGKVTKAVATEGSSPIARAEFDKGVLHIVDQDGDEWAMTLTSDTTAQLRAAGAGAPTNAEPIRLEKVWSEPPVQP
jgi:hypothetical protein